MFNKYANATSPLLTFKFYEKIKFFNPMKNFVGSLKKNMLRIIYGCLTMVHDDHTHHV